MSTTNTPNTFPGIFKEVYSDKVEKLIFPFAIYQEKYPLEKADLVGDTYIASPRLQLEHGFSYAPSSGASTLITLNAAVAGYIGRAKIQPFAIYLRSRIDYAAASRAAERGKRAIESAYRALMENMMESFQKRLEHNLLYGKDGLGTVETNTAGALVITAATWSAIFFGMEGAVLEAWTTTAETATQHNTDLTISAVDSATRTVTVTGTSAAVVATDILYFKGARSSTATAEAAGLNRALTNTGVLHNIDAAAYSAWKSQLEASVGTVSELAIGRGVVKAANAGLMEDAVIAISPLKWNILLQEQMAKRVLDQSYSVERTQSGSRYIRFYNVNGAPLELIPHPFIREGEAMLHPTKRLHRIGSTDITGQLDNLGEMVLHVPDANAYEIRMMSDCCLFLETPAMGTKYTGIT